MDTIAELVPVVLGLTLILSLVLPFVFVVQKVRGTPTNEALRFVGVGVGICFGVSMTFVLGVTAIGTLIDPDGTLREERDCERLGGVIQTFPVADGPSGTICVVG